MKKALRVGKIFVDWSQNDDHKTTICVYSLRAKDRPTVSTPVTWEEVENCLNKRDPNLLVFDAGQVLERVTKHGDLFAPVLKVKQKLPPITALTVEDVQTGSAKSVRRAASKSRTVKKAAKVKTQKSVTKGARATEANQKQA
jgi:bifunctional non-homologous end joining protein LigD